MLSPAGFEIVHSLLKIKSKLHQVKMQLSHKLSHQESEATFEHLGPNTFSFQEYPTKSPLEINSPGDGWGDIGRYV